MIACSLVVCSETMMFQFGNSLSHAQSGLSLFEDLLNDGLDVDDRDGLYSPKPNIIEDELVQQYYRMELQTMAVYDTRAPSAHWRLGKEGTASIRDMPKEFTSVEQARLHLDLVMRRTYHFMTYALADRATFLKFRDVGTQRNITSSSAQDLAPEEIKPRLMEASDELQVEQEIHCSENRRWSQAFEPLYRSALRNIDQAESIRVLLLKIHSLTTTIRLAGHLSKTEMIYDNFMPDFEKIVSLGKIVLNHPHADKFFAEGSFSLDLGLIYCLMTPATDCRDRRLRREAIALLSMRSWREAQWGSETSADVAKWIVEVEEDGVETESIPEWARARLSVIDASLEKKTAHLYCIRGVGKSLTHKDTLRYWGDMRG
jgi:hypothetical protein